MNNTELTKLVDSQPITSSQRDTIKKLVSSGISISSITKPTNNGLLKIKSSHGDYFIDTNGKILKNVIKANSLAGLPRVVTSKCPSCGEMQSFPRWNIYIKCRNCGANLRHVTLKGGN